MVRGLWIVTSGVGLRGELGPNAPKNVKHINKPMFTRSFARFYKIVTCNYPAHSHLHTTSLTNGTGDEQPQVESVCQLKNVVHTFDIDLERERNVLFTDCTQEGAEVHNCSDAFVDHKFFQVVVVKDVSVDKRSWKTMATM